MRGKVRRKYLLRRPWRRNKITGKKIRGITGNKKEKKEGKSKYYDLKRNEKRRGKKKRMKGVAQTKRKRDKRRVEQSGAKGKGIK